VQKKYNMNIGQRLKILRLKRELTLQDVAEKLGISRGNLSGIETGRVTPSLETLSRIATALGYKLAIVFCETDNIANYEEELYESICDDRRFK